MPLVRTSETGFIWIYPSTHYETFRNKALPLPQFPAYTPPSLHLSIPSQLFSIPSQPQISRHGYKAHQDPSRHRVNATAPVREEVVVFTGRVTRVRTSDSVSPGAPMEAPKVNTPPLRMTDEGGTPKRPTPVPRVSLSLNSVCSVLSMSSVDVTYSQVASISRFCLPSIPAPQDPPVAVRICRPTPWLQSSPPGGDDLG